MPMNSMLKNKKYNYVNYSAKAGGHWPYQLWGTGACAPVACTMYIILAISNMQW